MSYDTGKIQKLLKEQVSVEVAGVDSKLCIRVYSLFIHYFTTRVAERLTRTVSSWHAIRDEHLQGGKDRGIFPPSLASVKVAGQFEQIKRQDRHGCFTSMTFPREMKS